MGLKPEVSLTMSLGVATVVYAVYQNMTPTIADIRSAPSNDSLIDGSRKLAAWTSAGIVAGISLLAKDATVFIVGGIAIVGLDWAHRHANLFNPNTGTAKTVTTTNITQSINDPSDGGVA